MIINPYVFASGPPASYYDEVIADSPVAYWRLAEVSGTTAADDTTNHDATYVNTPTLGVAGAVTGNDAVSLNGAYALRSAAVINGTLPYTLECWVKTTATVDQNILVIGKSDNTKAAGINISAAGSVLIYSNGNGGTYYSAADSGTINDGAWHHVAAIVQSTGLELFVDGVSVASLSQAMTSATDYDRAALGAFINGGDAMNGSLDECAMYSSALSSGRIAAHHAAA